MRLATFNVQNLFERAAALDALAAGEHSRELDTYYALTKLLEAHEYDAVTEVRIIELLRVLGLDRSEEGEGIVRLRQCRGRLVRHHGGGALDVVATGRGDWTGWLELKRRAVDPQSTWNTARIIGQLDADVLGLVEVEGRAALAKFNAELLGRLAGTDAQRRRRFEHLMVIDGNDERGIDVGIMTRKDYPISFMRSHVHDRSPDGQPVFSRDCAEYLVLTPSGARVWILVNHFKSRYRGGPVGDIRRSMQATAVRDIYRQLVAAGEANVAVVGDLNDHRDSPTLAPLLADSGLRDIADHPRFDPRGLAGTYGGCERRDKIDYILLSPGLFERVRAGSVVRDGLWSRGFPRPPWPLLDGIASPEDAASDHAALWADIEL